jgi:hypothetical protein
VIGSPSTTAIGGSSEAEDGTQLITQSPFEGTSSEDFTQPMMKTRENRSDVVATGNLNMIEIYIFGSRNKRQN